MLPPTEYGADPPSELTASGPSVNRPTHNPQRSDFSDAAPMGTSKLVRKLAAPIAFVGLIVAQLLRNTSVLDRVWAEDGAVFGRQAFENHLWQQVGRGYAGYLVAPERVLAAPIVSVVPPNYWGRWFALSAMAVAAFSALAVYRLSGGILRARSTRGALALLVAVGPKMRGEWPAIANVGWPLLVAMFWVIISVRSDRLSTVVRCVIAGLAITASGLALVFVPLALAVLGARDVPVLKKFFDRPSMVHERERQRLKRADRHLGSVILVSAALQIIGLATAVAGPKSFRSTPIDIARLVMVRVFGSVLVGERFVDDAWKNWGMAFAVGAVAVIGTGLVFGVRRASVSTRSLAFAAIVYAVAIGVASLRTRGTEPFALQPGRFSFDAERYFIIPAFLVASAIAIVIDRRFEHPGHVTESVVATEWGREDEALGPPPAGPFAGPSAMFTVFVVVVLVATGFTQRNAEEPSEPWSVALRAARSACRNDRALRQVDIPIAPAGIFRLTVPCPRLR